MRPACSTDFQGMQTDILNVHSPVQIYTHASMHQDECQVAWISPDSQ